jgi:hypothetical protein
MRDNIVLRRGKRRGLWEETRMMTDQELDADPPATLTMGPQYPRIPRIPVTVPSAFPYWDPWTSCFILFSTRLMPISCATCLLLKRSLCSVIGIRTPLADEKSEENSEEVVHQHAVKVWATHPKVQGKWMKSLEINLSEASAVGGVHCTV